MPYNSNDPNYQTRVSRISSFNDFKSNINKEKEELKKLDRSTIKNNPETYQIPGNRKFKFNKVTHKMDDISSAEVDDKIDAIEDMGIKDRKHKYKISESNTDLCYSKDDMFDAFVAGDTESMRTGDEIDRGEFEDWFNTKY